MVSDSPLEATRAAVAEFFRNYQRAFEQRDNDALGACFESQVFVATDRGSDVHTALFDSAQWTRVLQRLLVQYDEMGVSGAELRSLTVLDVSSHIVTAGVHWTLFRQPRETIYEFNALYTLVRHPDRFRIAAIAHNEAARAGPRP